MEIMSTLRKLEPLSRTGSSGYDFSFLLRHLNFYLECKEAEIRLSSIMERISSKEAVRYSKDVISLLSRVAGNGSIIETAQRLEAVSSIFQGMREAFDFPDHGNLSDTLKSIPRRCGGLKWVNSGYSSLRT